MPDDERPEIPADACSDVPVVEGDGDGDGWYTMIFRAWGLHSGPFAREGVGDDPLYERTMLAFERDVALPPPFEASRSDDLAGAYEPSAEETAAMDRELWDAALDFLDDLAEDDD